MTATVSTVTKVKEGRHTFQFDLSDSKLIIEYWHGKKASVRITMGDFALKELGKLLFGGQPVIATSLPPDTPHEDTGKKTPEGLTRTSDGIQSGMAE